MQSLMSASMTFSYGGFAIFDRDVRLPGLDLSEGHLSQGFARRPSCVIFQTILNYGSANLRVNLGKTQDLSAFQRLIAVPFEVTSGRVHIEGPAEFGVNRCFVIDTGHYRLIAGQRVLTEREEDIEVFMERVAEPLTTSRILVADQQLRPPLTLIETADILEM